jgi:hypothetical protein
MAKDPFKPKAPVSEGAASYQAQEAAKHANMLRLRAERLAREAANPPPEPKPLREPKKRKRVIRKL